EDAPLAVRRQLPHSVRKLLRLWLGARGGGGWHRGRRDASGLDGVRRVRPHLRHRDLERREAALAHDDVHRELDAIEIAVLRVNAVEDRIAGIRDIDKRFDMLDQVIRVERRGDWILAE